MVRYRDDIESFSPEEKKPLWVIHRGNILRGGQERILTPASLPHAADQHAPRPV